MTSQEIFQINPTAPFGFLLISKLIMEIFKIPGKVVKSPEMWIACEVKNTVEKKEKYGRIIVEFQIYLFFKVFINI